MVRKNVVLIFAVLVFLSGCAGTKQVALKDLLEDAEKTGYQGEHSGAEVDAAINALDDEAALESKIGVTIFTAADTSANVESVLGAADYAAIKALLDLEIGTDVQAYDADLTTYAGITPAADVQSLLGAANYAAIISNMALQTTALAENNIWLGNGSGVAAATTSLSIDVVSATTSRAAQFDADGYLEAATTTLAQLNYLSDTTGPIQAQINALSAGFTTQTQVAYAEDPGTEDFDEMFFFGEAITITRVTCVTDTGTATLNIENGANDVLTADIVCDDGEQDSCASGCDVDTIDDANSYDDFAANSWGHISISATSGTPGKVSVAVTYTTQ